MTESSVLAVAFAGQQTTDNNDNNNNNSSSSKINPSGTTDTNTKAHGIGSSITSATSTTATAGSGASGSGRGPGRGGRQTSAGPVAGAGSAAGQPTGTSTSTSTSTGTGAATGTGPDTGTGTGAGPSVAAAAALMASTPTAVSSTRWQRPDPNNPKNRVSRSPSFSPRPVPVATASHDLNDAHTHIHGSEHGSPPLTRHSHRQTNRSSTSPSIYSADVKSGYSPPSSFPSQPQRLHHDAPSPALPNPVPARRQTPSDPDNIATAKLVADESADADTDRKTKAAHSSPPFAASKRAHSPPRAILRARASSSHQTSPQSATSSSSQSPSQSSSPPDASSSPVQSRRPTSCPEPGFVNDQISPSSAAGTTKYLTRRGPASRSSNGVSTSDGPPPSLSTQRLQALEAVARTGAQSQPPQPSQPSPETSTRTDNTQGRRELLLLKRLSESSSSDEGRHLSSQRPPVSYRSASKRHSIQPGSLTSGQVPPIRSFRSSGSRKSLSQEMNLPPRAYDLGEPYATSPEDQALHNFGGRHAQGGVSLINADSGRPDDGGDVFLRIAREEQASRVRDDDLLDDTQSSVSGIRRASHRRPLSTVAPMYHLQTSPPRMGRRLSDQQDRPRPTHLEDDQESEISHSATFRPLVREKAASVHPGDEILRTRSGGVNLRPSPLSARSAVGYDSTQQGSIYARRRASITDSNSTVGGRTPTYRAPGLGLGQGRNHGSSPLARNMDFQNRGGPEGAHGLEGTESTASTTAPSTVWDELDDLKSRINRLELTGKLPSTSGAAVSRMSDDRPATATTTVTTMSGSPKRQAISQAAEISSTTSSQKEAHPILHAALLKSKPFLSPEVYQALESAANDAMALSSMMGSPGQPGPISSAASVVGTGGPVVTDRQLRRKADSVCRSLTELCVALGDGVGGSAKGPGPTSPLGLQTQLDGPATPTLPKSYTGLPAPRRLSVAEQGIPKSISSPRALSKFEERRSSMLNGTALPLPRATGSTPTTPIEGSAQRRSSLMISRTRRAGTEEPELGRTPTILRSRRAGTEEPEEARQTSYLSRNRRGTVGEELDEGRFRPPSRAGTEVNMLRGQGREYPSETQSTVADATSQIPSALPRRRFLSTNIHSSRLAGPPGTNTISPRRYQDRQPGDQDMGENGGVGDSPGQRQFPPLSKGLAHTRASSLSTRRNRDSVISTNPGAPNGPYR